MFRFTAQGRIFRIQELKSNTLSITLVADRIVEGRDDTWTATEYLGCISFDAELNRQMLTDLEKNQNVTLEGRLIPRKRMVNDKPVYDTTMEITGYKRISKPKANGKHAPADQADASA